MQERKAGFWIRFAANLLDALIVGIPILLIILLSTGDWQRESAVLNVIKFLYSILLPVLWYGYTLGKKICGIQIRKIADHKPPDLGTMLMREMVSGLVYVLTFGIGLLISIVMVATREDKRAVHDLIAGTEVIYTSQH